ncbi:MAG: LysR family transcriptional regulator [Desulfarculaceae bacterium]|nr:LysR family transcriptional regulator [Desulfarculaceae bacterium]MCF8070869.1 LysR family transcriptional regulator [Desulfarculaceae bacterium]MCF8100457.1 LysR family transcriptional regulator [Desulfarculaceae bacterium]MCF8117957.1 LysR family transcriptional regulator [Desulfarculaceae bacterium]
MDLRRLQVFAKVYERRSFSRAAEEVFLSQPTVSGHIKSLEEELGVQLFDRLGREILPTKAAELLYDHARDILERVEDAQRSVDAFLGRLRGELVVGGSTIPGQYVLPSFIGRFRLLHPEVKVTLHIADTRQVAEAVQSGELEAGVVGASLEDERLAFSPLMDDVVTLAGWPGHPHGPSLEPMDLKSAPVVFREPGSGTRMFLARALKKTGMDPADMNIVAQMGSTMAVLQAVRAQVGLGFLSRRAILEELEAGRLVEVGLNKVNLKRQFYLVTRKKRTHSPAAQAFMALCLAGMEEE